MATYSPEILYKKINDVQETFGGLSQTSQFMVTLNLGRSTIRQSGVGPLNRYLTRCGLFDQSKSTEETYDFLCSDASLPGSSFDMAEESGSRQGVIERFPMRRIFADFDLTFYVDKEYNTIRIFEEWLNWIDPLSRGSNTYDGDEDGAVGFDESNSFFRMRYPNEYKTKISIVKFERGFLKNPNEVIEPDKLAKKLVVQPILVYDFIDAFPMNIAAIPFSYDGSSITKITVNFNYARYTVRKQNPLKKTQSDSEKQVQRYRDENLGIRGVSVNNAGAPPPVGFVNGQPYYGPFHKHMKSDGTVVLMVGAEHINAQHAIIYSTAAASIGGDTITGGTSSGYSSSSSDSSSSDSSSSSSDSSSDSSDSSSSDSSSDSSDSSDSSSSDSSSSSSDSSSSSSDSSSSGSSSSSSGSSGSSSSGSSGSSGYGY